MIFVAGMLTGAAIFFCGSVAMAHALVRAGVIPAKVAIEQIKKDEHERGQQ